MHPIFKFLFKLCIYIQIFIAMITSGLQKGVPFKVGDGSDRERIKWLKRELSFSQFQHI